MRLVVVLAAASRDARWIVDHGGLVVFGMVLCGGRLGERDGGRLGERDGSYQGTGHGVYVYNEGSCHVMLWCLNWHMVCGALGRC
jgi:hypothetical protein